MEKILIFLEEQWYKESLPGAAEAVQAYKGYGFDADLWIIGAQEGVTEALKEAEIASFGTLCIADSQRLLRQLADCGAAFTAYAHGANGGENLSVADYILMDPQFVDRDSLVKIWQRQRDLPWEILETERCAVREFVPGDLDAIYALYDEEAGRFLEPPSSDRAKELEILTSYIRRVYRLAGYGHWAVISKKSGELIGRVGYAFPQKSDTGPVPDASFGYLLRSDARGQGIAREVCSAILQYGFEELGFETIGADASISNIISDKILRSFSFVPVAEEQNQRYYILHKTDWRKQP